MKQKILLTAVAGVLCWQTNAQHAPVAEKPIKVELRQTDSSYQLFREGKPYFIKGAGGSAYLYRVAAYGGNSIRTWSTRDAKKILDSAHHYGLTVLMGLPVTPERHGFDYNDTTAVRRQFERVREEVKKYKNHPAVLAWGIGNELNLQYQNPKVWDAVNEMAKMIQAEDPNHPATTVLAGINKREVDYIKEHCPAISILSINTYGGLASLPRQVRAVGWNGPYMVTEWGPTGHWESGQTEWKMPIEETSSEKAVVYKNRYEQSVERDRKKCLGSYVFLWGQKQERTPTWYGVFTESGEESEVVDVMHYLWTGNWPANKAPHLYSFQLDQKKAADNIYVTAGGRYEVKAEVADPDNDRLTYRWELLHEPTKVGEGGDYEDRPTAVKSRVQDAGKGKAVLQAPEAEGAYRIFVYATDGHGNVATANIPFYVKKRE